ncbi:MAG: DUF1080 domain-containing protein [Tannerella sp.]|jgi:hypothetical protein|nr:DUF1080 domain-containing protein [Tannerella sp.]
MKQVSFFLAGLCGALLLSCSPTPSGSLFNGKDASRWQASGSQNVSDGVWTLSGGATALLKKGDYKNFSLSLELQTTPGGKGAVWFHTDRGLDKGYRVAVNNDRSDPVWWRMSGSLISVRNLAKSFIKENTWYKMEIRVEGHSIKVGINGQPVVDYIEPAKPYRVGANKNALLSDGIFAISSTGKGAIRIRSIQVKALPELEPEQLSAQLSKALNEQTDKIIRLHQEDFPVLDYHVHLKGGLSKEVAAAQSRRLGINYAIAPNCGIGFPIQTDQDIKNFLDTMRTQPFILPMQAEGREWTKTFSPEVRGQFDYIFTDAMTFTDDHGRRTRLWIAKETWIDNEEKYMDMILDRILKVLKEPADVYVNPCYLPPQMQDRYDHFWTEARQDRFIKALKESGKALEINELYQIPSLAILRKAKAAGVKFTFGSNNVTPNVSDLSYSLRMKDSLQLKPSDMYKPKIKI